MQGMNNFTETGQQGGSKAGLDSRSVLPRPELLLRSASQALGYLCGRPHPVGRSRRPAVLTVWVEMTSVGSPEFDTRLGRRK